MMKCPKCGSYSDVFLKCYFGNPIVEYKCRCGWSSLGQILVENKTRTYNPSVTNVTSKEN